jgi:hypothetical protein
MGGRGQFNGQGEEIQIGFGRGEKGENEWRTYICMTKEGEERKRMVEKRACRLKKESGADA